MIGFIFLCCLTICNGQKKKERFPSNVMGSNNFIDSVPHFSFERAELDSFFLLTSRIPQEADLSGINGFVKLSFRVDSMNRINSIEVLDARAMINEDLYQWKSDSTAALSKNYYKGEAIRMLKCTDGLWVPATKYGRYYDSQVIADIHFKTDMYDKNAKNVKAIQDNSKIGVHVNMVWQDGHPINRMKLQDNYNVGVRKMSQQKFPLAVIYFKEAVAFNSNDLDSYYNMGVAYKKMNRNQEACDCWTKGKELGDNGAMKLYYKYCNN